VRDLLEGLGEGVDDDVGFAAAKALDGELGLVGVFSGVPEANDDAVVGQVRPNALTDGAGLGEGEGGKSGDEDDGAGFGGERVEDLAGDGGSGKEEGLVVGLLHELNEHLAGELVGLIVGGDADDGEVFAVGGGDRGVRCGGAVAVGGLFGAVVGEFGDEFADAEEEEVAADVVEVALVAVLLDKGERGDEDGVVELDEGFVFEIAGGDGVGLLLIAGEEALVEEGVGGEFGVGAEESVEEGELRNVAAEDDDADGERRGEDEAGPSPEQGPEDGHGKECERRDAGARAEEPGLDEVGGGELERKEEAEDEKWLRPGVEDGDGDDERQDEAGGGSDVGNDAKECGEDSPEGGVWNADEEQAEAEEGSVGCVDGGLEEEILADAGSGILERARHETDAAHAGEEEDAIAEVLALHEEVDGEDDDDTEGSNGPKEAHDEIGGGLQLSTVGVDDADGLHLCGGFLAWGRGAATGEEILEDFFDSGEGFLKGLLGGGVDRSDFTLNVETIGGKVACDV